MNVVLNRRAEIALRSLSGKEQLRVEKLFSRLIDSDEQDWWRSTHAQKLQIPGEDNLYSIRASEQLRLIAKFLAGSLIVQDIVPIDRLSRIAGPLQ